MRARGFSLVEAVVAATVLAIGLLAVVASARAIQRLDLLGRRTAEAAEAAASRFAALRAGGCARASSGSASGAISETWRVAGPGAFRGATVIVAFAHDARARAASYDAILLCGRAP